MTLALTVTLGLAFHWKGPEILKKIVEQGFKDRFGSEVKTAGVRWEWTWPLTVTIDDLSLERPTHDFKFKVKSAVFSLGLSDILFEQRKIKPFFTIAFLQPQIEFHMNPSGHSKKGNSPKNWPSGTAALIQSMPLLGDVATNIQIKNAHLELYREKEQLFTAADMDLELTLSSVTQGFDIDLKTRLIPAQEGLDYPIPISLKSTILWKDDRIELLKNQLNVLSLSAQLSAFYQSKNDTYEIKLKSAVDELHNFQPNEASFPFHDWAGSLFLRADIDGKWGEPYHLMGDLNLKNFNSYFQWSYGELKTYGNIKGILESHFDGVEKVQFTALNWNVDATDMTVAYSSFFRKPPKVKLTTQGAGEFLNGFYIKDARLDFVHLICSGRGFMTPQGISHFSFSTPAFALQGLESFIPVLSEKPMKGMAEIRGEVVKEAGNYQYNQIRLQPLRIQNLETYVNYKKDNVEINGPLSGNFILTAEGPWNKLDFWQSPVVISGEVQAHLPQVTYSTNLTNLTNLTVAPATKIGDQKSEGTAASEPFQFAFFPSSKLIENLQLNTKIHWDGFKLDNLILTGINLNSQISNGEMKAQGEIDSVFSGQVILKKAVIPLTTKNPIIQWTSHFSNINMERFLATLFPQWKNLALGDMSGEVSASSFLPSSPNFSASVKAQGQFMIQNGMLTTLPFDYLAKTVLSITPDIGDRRPIYTGPQKMQLSAQFNLTEKILNLTRFIASTATHDEFDFEGTLDVESRLNLKGHVFLTEAPVLPRFFNSNLDSHHRLTVPMSLAGNLSNPDLRLIQPTSVALNRKPLADKKVRQPASAAKKPPDGQRKVTKMPLKKDLFQH
jgi:hypothetical protein